ncbi:30S ribosomal protein S27ae [Candidatus Pacearchaeota archaeon]|nr:30S ribosomal protein S27ae [Candidatus Pacearchaeota archaeon]
MAEKKAGKTGKKKHKNKPTSKKYAKYKIEGNKIIRGKTCPRCGAGIFLMEANNRLYCGNCHYTSFEKKQ